LTDKKYGLINFLSSSFFSFLFSSFFFLLLSVLLLFELKKIFIITMINQIAFIALALFVAGCSAQCAARAYDHATWPQTNVGSVGTGVCDSNAYSSSVATDACDTGNAWANSIQNRCYLLGNCPADTTTGDASWAATLSPQPNASPTVVNGKCNGGYSGAPTRTCTFPGTWSTTVGGTPCTREFDPFSYNQNIFDHCFKKKITIRNFYLFIYIFIFAKLINFKFHEVEKQKVGKLF
jgi:hypothetical protein